MIELDTGPLIIRQATREQQGGIHATWGDVAARHCHFEDGFTLLARSDVVPAGLIAVVYQPLPSPLDASTEAFIDIIEVVSEYRRQGVARQMIAEAARLARVAGAIQLRAWSSEDKTAALRLWQALGFGLCPATTYPGGRPVAGYFVARPL